jgi:hypothetical protein
VEETLYHRFLENDIPLTSDIYNYLNHYVLQLRLSSVRRRFFLYRVITRELHQDKYILLLDTIKREFERKKYHVPYRAL